MDALVLVYDIRGYSAAARRLPGVEFAKFIGDAHPRILEAFSGRPPDFSKNLGDGYLLIWRSAAADLIADAVDGARRAQAEYRALAARASFEGMRRLPLDMGVGIALGPVQERGDFYGHAVNVAARLQDVARPRGIVMDDAAWRAVPEARRSAWREPVIRERAALKGVGRVACHWLAPLTRGERVRRLVRRTVRRVGPLLAPLLTLLWIDGGLPFPGGSAIRGAIDSLDLSLLRPHDELESIDREARERVGASMRELRRRLNEDTGRAHYGGDLAPEYFAWIDGAVLAALSPRDAEWTRRCVDQLFEGAPAQDGRPLVEFVPGEGWWRHPTEPWPHFESTAWVFLGLVRACGDPTVDSPRLRERVRQAYEAVVNYFDPACGGWHWKLYQAPSDIYGNPDPGNEHYVSVYNTMMAAWGFLEAERIGVDEVNEPAREARLLARTLDWLLSHYIEEARGWAAEYYPPARETVADCRDGLSLQIFWLMMRAEEILPDRPLPDSLAAGLHARLLETLDRNVAYPVDRHKWVTTRFADAATARRYAAGDASAVRQLTRVRDTVDFLWIPWAFGAARFRLERHALSRRERVEMLRVLTHLGRLAREDLGEPRIAWSFRLWEPALAVESPGARR